MHEVKRKVGDKLVDMVRDTLKIYKDLTHIKFLAEDLTLQKYPEITEVNTRGVQEVSNEDKEGIPYTIFTGVHRLSEGGVKEVMG